MVCVVVVDHDTHRAEVTGSRGHSTLGHVRVVAGSGFPMAPEAVARCPGVLRDTFALGVVGGVGALPCMVQWGSSEVARRIVRIGRPVVKVIKMTTVRTHAVHAAATLLILSNESEVV